MRGKVSASCGRVEAVRITPAYAGKSIPVEVIVYGKQDHPRLCGEKMDIRQELRKNPGSPPPMRGKVITEVREKPETRITPAYAGKR